VISNDYRDLVIAQLADSEAALLDLLAALTVEHFVLRRQFLKILRLSDEARQVAVSQSDTLSELYFRLLDEQRNSRTAA
jgi:hypothetical protein